MIPVPCVSPRQMREVEGILVQEYGFHPVQMMENGGRDLALVARILLDHDLDGRSVVILAGPGQKGGGGLVCARHLFNRGVDVQVLLSHPVAAYLDVTGQQLAILQQMGLATAWAEDGWELPPADLVVDALLGQEHIPPTGISAALIELANSARAPILSLEAPSGLDLASGHLYAPAMRATATLTLALPGAALFSAEGRGVAGDLYLGDIGVPPALYSRLGFDVPPLFSGSAILPLLWDGERVCVRQGNELMHTSGSRLQIRDWE